MLKTSSTGVSLGWMSTSYCGFICNPEENDSYILYQPKKCPSALKSQIIFLRTVADFRTQTSDLNSTDFERGKARLLFRGFLHCSPALFKESSFQKVFGLLRIFFRRGPCISAKYGSANYPNSNDLLMTYSRHGELTPFQVAIVKTQTGNCDLGDAISSILKRSVGSLKRTNDHLPCDER